MSETADNIVRQKQKGYTLLAGAVIILVGGILVFRYYGLPPISYVGMLVPVGILAFLGYRAISAGQESVALQDERTVELYGQTGHNAFWWLISIILTNEVFNILPEEGADFLYIVIGMVIYSINLVYYRLIA